MTYIKTVTIMILILPFFYVPAGAEEDYHASGLEAFKASDYKAAKKYFVKAGEQFPDNKAVAYNLGVTLYQLGNFTGAIDNLTASITSDPEFGKAFFARGVVKLKMNKKEQAKMDFKKGCELNYRDGCTVLSNL